MNQEPVGDTGVPLQCDLIVPAAPRGIVLLVDSDWSYSALQRMQILADRLSVAGYVACCVDPTPQWGVSLVSRQMPNEITRIAERVISTTDAIRNESEFKRLPIGLLGFGQGSAAAMLVAAEKPDVVRAIVTADGRPDLAEVQLHRVVAPSLFIITRDDRELHELNRWAQHRVNCATRLDLVPKPAQASQKGSDFDQLSRSATRWYDVHLMSKRASAAKRTVFGLPVLLGGTARTSSSLAWRSGSLG